MIRILHYGLDSHLGGIETYLYKLATHINKEKFHFDFLTIGNEEPCYYKEFSDMGSEFYSVTPRSVNPLKNKNELINLFTSEKFDIIHCHMNSLSYSTPITVGLKSQKNVIVHSRNAQAPKSLKTKLLHEFNSAILPKKKIEMLAVSDLAGEWMFGKGTDFTVINNGIDINKFKFNEKSRKKIRSELGLENQFCVIHVGAFREQKNHLFLLEVFKHIVEMKPNSTLLLVGSGKLLPEIETKIEELGIRKNVILLGNRSDISDLLSASDAFLFPSLYEGFPNAVLEAQTSGLPCLISDSITKEVLINFNCLSLSLDKEPSEWANKLLSLQSYENRKQGAESIKNEGFSVEDEVKKIENLYLSLIEKKL